MTSSIAPLLDPRLLLVKVSQAFLYWRKTSRWFDFSSLASCQESIIVGDATVVDTMANLYMTVTVTAGSAAEFAASCKEEKYMLTWLRTI